MSKPVTVMWDETTRHTETFEVADDFPDAYTGDPVADDRIDDRLEELVRNSSSDDADIETIGLSVHGFHHTS